MGFQQRVSVRLASALIICLVVVVSPASAQGTDVPVWQDAQIETKLIAKLEAWLDNNSEYPRHPEAPRIRWIDARSAKTLSKSRFSAHTSTPRGLYDDKTKTIWLVNPWSPHNAYDVSVLLHELVHHRQAFKGHWYCPAAQELPAYKLQQAWLASLDLELNVSWFAIILDSACARRDFHPD